MKKFLINVDVNSEGSSTFELCGESIDDLDLIDTLIRLIMEMKDGTLADRIANTPFDELDDLCIIEAYEIKGPVIPIYNVMGLVKEKIELKARSSGIDMDTDDILNYIMSNVITPLVRQDLYFCGEDRTECIILMVREYVRNKKIEQLQPLIFSSIATDIINYFISVGLIERNTTGINNCYGQIVFKTIQIIFGNIDINENL